MKEFLSIFMIIFFAELGDKTQVSTMLFASKNDTNHLTVFFAASLALILSTFLAIFLGNLISKFVDPIWIKRIAGVGFIVIGLWTLWRP